MARRCREWLDCAGLALFVGLLLSVSGWASLPFQVPPLKPASGATFSYTGPGDIASFTDWYGLRSFTSAIASAGTQNIVRLTRMFDSATCILKPQHDNTQSSYGLVDTNVANLCNGSTQTAKAWASAGSVIVGSPGSPGGQDAICTGSATPTVLTITSCSQGTIQNHDAVTTATINSLATGGVGFTAGTFISSFGTGTGGAGTYNLSGNSNTVSSQTVWIMPGVAADTFYDQAGSRDLTCSGGCTTAAANFMFDAIGANKPALWQPTLTQTFLSAANFTPATGEMSMEAVGMRVTSSTDQGEFVCPTGGSHTCIDAQNVANKWCIPSGCVTQATANDGTFHFASALCNGANPASKLVIDGATPVSGGCSKDTSAAKTQIDPDWSFEGGFLDNSDWGAGTSTTGRRGLCNNANTYVGIPSGACAN